MCMSWDERWALIDSDARPVRPGPEGPKQCKPNYVACLYTNTPMPHGPAFNITLYADNVYCGTLSDHDDTDNVDMRWVGYTCQLYDGELKMCPVRGEAGVGAHITGTCNGIAFRFDRVALTYGCWPGFLALYESN